MPADNSEELKNPRDNFINYVFIFFCTVVVTAFSFACNAFQEEICSLGMPRVAIFFASRAPFFVPSFVYRSFSFPGSSGALPAIGAEIL